MLACVFVRVRVCVRVYDWSVMVCLLVGGRVCLFVHLCGCSVVLLFVCFCVCLFVCVFGCVCRRLIVCVFVCVRACMCRVSLFDQVVIWLCRCVCCLCVCLCVCRCVC